MKNITIDGVEYTPVIKEENKVITKTFEVYHKDLGVMSWEDAKKACESLGEGWRLPTKEELDLIYQNKEVVGGFANNFYWSSTEYDLNFAWFQNINSGNQYLNFKYPTLYVRAIRDL